MTVTDILPWAVLGVQVLLILGFIFSTGRVYERLGHMEKGQQEIKDSLFGGMDQEGIFLRRSEARLIQEKEVGTHEAFDRQLGEFRERLALVERRRS